MKTPLKWCVSQLFDTASIVGVPVDTSRHRQSSTSSVVSLGRYLYRASLARALGREIGSCYWRIRELLGTQLHRRGVVCRLERQPTSPRSGFQPALDGYTQDMRRKFAACPWMTLIDVQTFLEGWTLGAAWVAHNSGNKSLSSEELAWLSSLSSSEVVPEHSKCGPSAPLPSRE